MRCNRRNVSSDKLIIAVIPAVDNNRDIFLKRPQKDIYYVIRYYTTWLGITLALCNLVGHSKQLMMI